MLPWKICHTQKKKKLQNRVLTFFLVVIIVKLYEKFQLSILKL